MLMRELANHIKIAEKKAYGFASKGKTLCFKVGCSARRLHKSGANQWVNGQEKKDAG